MPVLVGSQKNKLGTIDESPGCGKSYTSLSKKRFFSLTCHSKLSTYNSTCMSFVTLKGTRFPIADDIPAVGLTASDFTFVKKDLSEGTLYDDYDGKIKVLIAVPSLDTGICQMETRRFNQELEKREGVTGLIISEDLPFAMNRFCEAEGLEKVTIASDYRYRDFIQEYNTEILKGPMKGLSARAVFVLDADNKIQYSELVPEIAQEPQYEEALAVVDKLMG